MVKYETHYDEDTGEWVGVCNICGEEYRTPKSEGAAKMGIRRHLKVHAGEKEGVKTSKELKEADEFHLDEMDNLRKIIAEACGKTFPRTEAIVRLFSRQDPDNLEGLADILRLARVDRPAEHLILKLWSEHRNVELPDDLKGRMEKEKGKTKEGEEKEEEVIDRVIKKISKLDEWDRKIDEKELFEKYLEHRERMRGGKMKDEEEVKDPELKGMDKAMKVIEKKQEVEAFRKALEGMGAGSGSQTIKTLIPLIKDGQPVKDEKGKVIQQEVELPFNPVMPWMNPWGQQPQQDSSKDLILGIMKLLIERDNSKRPGESDEIRELRAKQEEMERRHREELEKERERREEEREKRRETELKIMEDRIARDMDEIKGRVYSNPLDQLTAIARGAEMMGYSRDSHGRTGYDVLSELSKEVRGMGQDAMAALSSMTEGQSPKEREVKPRTERERSMRLQQMAEDIERRKKLSESEKDVLEGVESQGG